ncbi:MAG TPA: methyltransferase domain-containing protein [Rhizomicrobium sp.]|nr:methyltransferase domain-containing protein [Rhizomicrobium sp.]
MLQKLIRRLTKTHPRRRGRLVMDLHVRVGDFSLPPSQPFDLDKEDVSRRYVLGEQAPSGSGLRFLDVGGRDGRLSYLLGYDGPLRFNPSLYARNKALFDAKYDYYGVDLEPAGPRVLSGNLCTRTFLESHPQFPGSFDIVYSNNVFEHFARPWIAAENLLTLLKTGGLCITIVPFAQRYHESPGDYFRYTPQGVISLFESAGPVEVLVAGFDIKARRYDWQGDGAANDIVPVDQLGAWRETWLSCIVIRKS